MIQSMKYFIKDDQDTKRLQREFDDRRILMGFNQKTKRNEVWYLPDRSHPYRIAEPVNVQQAIKILESRRRYDCMRAKDLLRSIDEHNDKLTANIQADAMAEIKSQLKNVAAGRRFYT